ncbi:MAG: aminopeptidase YwaD [Marivirga sp.]|jgi:aminopeptidase YwaD
MKKLSLSLLAFLFVAVAYAQSDNELTVQTVTKDKIEGHIHFLAADELRGREVGTPEIDIAAKYISTSFMKYGVKPINGSFFQNVPMVKNVPPQSYSVSINNVVVSADNMMRMNGADMEHKSAFVFVNYGTEDDFKKVIAEGKIIVAMAGTEEDQGMRAAFGARAAKIALAKAAGAAGLVELFNEQPAQWDGYKEYFSHGSVSLGSNETQAEAEDFFLIWAIDAESKIKQALKLKMSTAEVTISASQSITVNSKNVVGVVEGTDAKLKDEFIIYSAHYDHNGVGAPNEEGDSIYNGARDNAVGVVTVMSAAENIAKYPTKRSALFILFTAEEKGLLGSKYYVENPLLPLNQMVYCFNSDNGGYNDTSLATIVGLERTTAAKHIKTASTAFGLKAIDDPAGEQGLFDRSDNVNFAKVGIPAPTFSLGFSAFDEEIMKYYHQTADNPDNMDYVYLEKFFKAYVLACRLIANDPTTPFWTEGDKYYEAGKTLYDTND